MKSILLASLAVGLLTAIVSPDAAADKDKAALQGTWKVTSSQAYGKESPAEEHEPMRIVFDGDKVRVTGLGDEEYAATYTLDASKTPRQIDSTLTSGDQKGEIVQGIYKIEDGTVTICWSNPGDDRPTEFKTMTGSEQRLFVLKKAE